jgi:hypothetical protein
MSNVVEKTIRKASIVKELFVFLWENKLWWMIPFVSVVVLVGLLLVFAQTSPVAPFMYALF